MQHRFMAAGIQLENCTEAVGTAKSSRPVKIAAGILNQISHRRAAIEIAVAKAVQHNFLMRIGQFEYSALILRTAECGRAIKIALRILNQTGRRRRAVRSAHEYVQHLEIARAGKLKNSTATGGRGTRAKRISTFERGAI